MAEPTQYRIKNWTRFQHYKDRSPEWIKLHFAILASEDWTMLADTSKLLAVVCMLVASRHNGMVPNKPAYLKRIAYLDAEPDLAPLISCGFLENPLADASEPEQMRTNACLEEIRVEEKREEKKEERASAPAKKDYVFEGKVINLTAEDLRKWQKSFHLVPDVLAEVIVADAYYATADEADRKRAFFKISQWLKKIHDSELAKRAKEREADERIHRSLLKMSPEDERAAYERQKAEYAMFDARRAADAEAMH